MMQHPKSPPQPRDNLLRRDARLLAQTTTRSVFKSQRSDEGNVLIKHTSTQYVSTDQLFARKVFICREGAQGHTINLWNGS